MAWCIRSFLSLYFVVSIQELLLYSAFLLFGNFEVNFLVSHNRIVGCYKFYKQLRYTWSDEIPAPTVYYQDHAEWGHFFNDNVIGVTTIKILTLICKSHYVSFCELPEFLGP